MFFALFLRFPFYFFFSVSDGKRQKTCFHAKTNYFHQQTVCGAPVCWSKYTTLTRWALYSESGPVLKTGQLSTFTMSDMFCNDKTFSNLFINFNRISFVVLKENFFCVSAQNGQAYVRLISKTELKMSWPLDLRLRSEKLINVTPK